MKRFVSLIFSFALVALLVFSLLPCVFAEPLDYTDYITNITTVDGTDKVDVIIPVDYITIYNDQIGTIKSGEVFIDSTAGPLQTIFHSVDVGINGSDIPDDSVIGINLRFEADFVEGIKNAVKFTGAIAHFSDSPWSNRVTEAVPFETYWFDNDDTDYAINSVVSFRYSAMAGYPYFSPTIIVTSESVRFNLELTFIKLTLNISSMLLQQQQTGKTNKLLDAIEDKLEAQGKTLDQILNGTPGDLNDAQSSAGAIKDQQSELGDLTDQMQVAKPNVGSVNVKVDSLVDSASVTSLSSMIAPLLSSSVMTPIFGLLGALMLISYVLFGKKG